jgi:hypothetical protein
VTISVNPKTVYVTNANASGPGSFLQAMTIAAESNSPGADTILFKIPGSEPFEISPNQPLPVLAHPTILNGYSQAGAHQLADHRRRYGPPDPDRRRQCRRRQRHSPDRGRQHRRGAVPDPLPFMSLFRYSSGFNTGVRAGIAITSIRSSWASTQAVTAPFSWVFSRSTIRMIFRVVVRSNRPRNTVSSAPTGPDHPHVPSGRV